MSKEAIKLLIEISKLLVILWIAIFGISGLINYLF